MKSRVIEIEMVDYVLTAIMRKISDFLLKLLLKLPVHFEKYSFISIFLYFFLYFYFGLLLNSNFWHEQVLLNCSLFHSSRYEQYTNKYLFLFSQENMSQCGASYGYPNVSRKSKKNIAFWFKEKKKTAFSTSNLQ